LAEPLHRERAKNNCCRRDVRAPRWVLPRYGEERLCRLIELWPRKVSRSALEMDFDFPITSHCSPLVTSAQCAITNRQGPFMADAQLAVNVSGRKDSTAVYMRTIELERPSPGVCPASIAGRAKCATSPTCSRSTSTESGSRKRPSPQPANGTAQPSSHRHRLISTRSP
jgi:hypothetical protein